MGSTSDKIKGTANELAGKAKQAAGKATDNPKLRAEGAGQEAKGKTQKAINEEAQANFEREMSKLKAYFRKRGIPVIVYTDKDLQDHAKIFADIEDYLTPDKLPKQLEFHALEDFLAFKSPK